MRLSESAVVISHSQLVSQPDDACGHRFGSWRAALPLLLVSYMLLGSF